MQALNSYKEVLMKYAIFRGRATRSEYWYFVLVNTIIVMVLFYALGPIGHMLYVIYALGVLVPTLAVATRRLHDTNRSAWWFLILLIPLVGSIIWIVFMATDSTADNKYGPNPKGTTFPATEAPVVPTPVS